jgi:hypothetical protein
MAEKCWADCPEIIGCEILRFRVDTELLRYDAQVVQPGATVTQLGEREDTLAAHCDTGPTEWKWPALVGVHISRCNSDLK